MNTVISKIMNKAIAKEKTLTKRKEDLKGKFERQKIKANYYARGLCFSRRLYFLRILNFLFQLEEIVHFLKTFTY